jgi:hypothetical protein
VIRKKTLSRNVGGHPGKVWNYPLAKYVEKGTVPVLPPENRPAGEKVVTREEAKIAVDWLSERYHLSRPELRFNVTESRNDRKKTAVCAIHTNGEHYAGLPISEAQCVMRFAEDLLGSFNGKYIALREKTLTLETMFHEFYHYVDSRNHHDKRLPPHDAKLEELYNKRAKEDVAAYRAQRKA